MATVCEKIGEYVHALRYADLPGDVTDYTKRILLDSLACLYGGLHSEPARMVRETIEVYGGAPQATVVATGQMTAAQHAGLANSVAIRFQDFNDVYFGPAWTAHPSDNIGNLLAVAEWKRRGGKDFLEAMVAAYEVQMRFSDLPVAQNLWHRGWHHTAACAYAGAAGAAKLLGLDAQQTANALALSGARSNTFAEIRHGNIPHDKALSAPMVSSTGIFDAMLAERGFTGSLTLLEGPYGFKAAVAGGTDVAPLVPAAGDFRILKVGLKPYPIEGMTPAMVEAALILRSKYAIKPDDVTAIRILAHEEAVTKPSWDSKKFRPDSKETADHSFYYCVAVALIAGEVTSKQFDREWLQNKTVHALMDKTTLEADPELTALFKTGARPATLEIATANAKFRHEVKYPLGDPKNPFTWNHVRAKFVSQAGPVIDGRRFEEIMQRAQNLEAETDMSSFMQLLKAE